MKELFKMAADAILNIFVPTTPTDPAQYKFVMDLHMQLCAKFHLRFMIFYDFLKNMITDYGCRTPSWMYYSLK